MRTAEIIRITPRISLSAAAGTTPTNRPPATAPITDPAPIGATILVRSCRSSNAPRLRCRSTPTATVGRLMSKLAVPAAFMSAPKANRSVGMMSSPPATPNRVLTLYRSTPRNPDGTLAPLEPMVEDNLPGFQSSPPDRQAAIRCELRLLESSFNSFVEGLSVGELRLPTKNWDGQMMMTTTTAETALGRNPSANLFFVETYGISSFLGDYGLGPTVCTFTLLSGEETKISVKTWRSTQSKVAEASSIVDSYTTEAGSRFTNTVQQETTDKANRQNKESWHEERYSPECVEGKF